MAFRKGRGKDGLTCIFMPGSPYRSQPLVFAKNTDVPCPSSPSDSPDEDSRTARQGPANRALRPRLHPQRQPQATSLD